MRRLTGANRCIYIYLVSELPPLVCACANLRRASRAVTALYDEELRPCGLRSTQFGLLKALERKGELGQGQLSAGLVLDSTTLTRTLGLLRKSGWIEIRPGDDRRERRIRLTERGRELTKKATPYWERAQRRLHGALGAEEWERLQTSLRRVTESIQSE